ncbi:MAG: hypothetical protein FJ104_10800 [Deltaproteobacteria bacterium]|nr:hypothetical protein [Deltaproteobacteria bacterium]
MHRSRHALALALACLALGLLDVARASLRSPLSIDLWLTLVAWLVATGAALTIAGPLLWLRMQIVRTLPARFWFAIGALDGAFVGHYGLMREKTASVPRARLELIAYSCVVVGAAVAAVAPRVSRRILPWLSLASALGVLAVAELLPAREKQWLRFALDMVALGGLATALDHLLEARVRRALPARFIGPSLLACALASHGTLHEAEQVRRFVFDFAAHSQAFLWPLREYTPAPRGRDPALGPVACAKAGFSARPAPAPLRAATRTGAARGADVLMVSIDALRHDRVDTLPELWKAVGPHARFTRAAAPAPHDELALGAGPRRDRASDPVRRALAFRDGAPRRAAHDRRGARRAGVSSRAGTHAPLLPPEEGHEPRLRARADGRLRRNHDQKEGRVPDRARGDRVRTGRRDRGADGEATPAVGARHGDPRAISVGRGEGPISHGGQIHACRDLAPKAAAFVARFRAARAGRPLIVAVFGDHGEEFGEHGGNFHSTSVHAEQARTVFALAAPGVGDATIDAPISHSSLPATLLDLLGEAPAPSFTEPSLLPCLDDRAQCPRVAVTQMVGEGNPIGYTVDRYRLVADPRRALERLYDTERDPGEAHDLSREEPETFEKVRAMALEYDRARCVD